MTKRKKARKKKAAIKKTKLAPSPDFHSPARSLRWKRDTTTVAKRKVDKTGSRQEEVPSL